GVEEMNAAGLISRNDVVKILGDGALTSKVELTAHAFSKSAIAAIEAQGGSATIL
ncbi:MAG: uL15m family ribosomal protein, partial [Mucinivorans sp.]